MKDPGKGRQGDGRTAPPQHRTDPGADGWEARANLFLRDLAEAELERQLVRLHAGRPAAAAGEGGRREIEALLDRAVEKSLAGCHLDEEELVLGLAFLPGGTLGVEWRSGSLAASLAGPLREREVRIREKEEEKEAS